MTKRLCLGLLASFVAVAAASTPAAAQQQQKPNILFIMGDDIGWMQPRKTTNSNLCKLHNAPRPSRSSSHNVSTLLAAEFRRMPPIKLSDSQLDAVMRGCAPLQPDARGAFLEAVAEHLQDREIGDGTVYLAIAKAQKEFFAR